MTPGFTPGSHTIMRACVAAFAALLVFFCPHSHAVDQGEARALEFLKKSAYSCAVDGDRVVLTNRVGPYTGAPLAPGQEIFTDPFKRKSVHNVKRVRLGETVLKYDYHFRDDPVARKRTKEAFVTLVAAEGPYFSCALLVNSYQASLQEVDEAQRNKINQFIERLGPYVTVRAGERDYGNWQRLDRRTGKIAEGPPEFIRPGGK